MPRGGHSLTGRALCAVVAEQHLHICGKLQYLAKPQPPQTTYPARPQHPVQALPHLLHTVEPAFDLAVAQGMPGAGHSHTGRALCAVVVAKRSLHILKTPAFSNYFNTHKPPAQPGRSTQCRLYHHTCFKLQRLHLTLQWPMTCPGLATHTLTGLCALWLPSSASTFGNSSIQQSYYSPHKPPAQPGCSCQCRLRTL